MLGQISAGLGVLAIAVVAVTAADNASEGEYHRWTDSTGTFGVEAQFVGITYDRETKVSLLTLRKRDGTTISVDVKRLSGESRALAVRLNAALRSESVRDDGGRPSERTEPAATGRFDDDSASSLPVFDIHFCVITKNPEAHAVATLEQLKKEVDILNTYFITEKRESIVRFRFKSAHFYKDVADLKCGFVEIGDGGVPYDSDGWARRFNECPHPQVRDPQAINFYVYDSYGANGAADQTSHGKRNSNRPYVLIDWQRLNHTTQSAEEHEMGHAFGLEHVQVPGATMRTHTNIMASVHAGGSGGLKDIGFNSEQVATIMQHAAITHKKLFGQPMPSAK
jgi:hypothetical protein